MAQESRGFTQRGTRQHSKEPMAIPINLRPEELALEPHKVYQEASRKERDGETPQTAEVHGLYIISVAARILNMHPQTLRKYERLGLIRPSRTVGMLRLYSDEDIAKLRLIRYLENNLGLNLAGVEFTLTLLQHLLEMRQKFSVQTRFERMDAIFGQEMKRLFELLNLPL